MKYLVALFFILFISLAACEFLDFFEINVAAACKEKKLVGKGKPCGNAYTDDVSVGCYQTLQCNITDTSKNGTCVNVTPYGTTCDKDSDCQGLSVAPLSCIKGKCGQKLGYDNKCDRNEECVSGMCNGGKCAGQPSEANCTKTAECIISPTVQYFCHAKNNTCEEVGKENEACTTQDSCQAGLYCVKEKITEEEGACKKPATTNNNCTATNVKYPNCDPMAKTMCFEGKCVAYQSRKLNETCNMGDLCAEGLACNTDSGKCEEDVECTDLNAAQRCKSATYNGYCKCNTKDKGVCAIASTKNCASEQTAYQNCVKNNCPYVKMGATVYGRAGYPYTTDHCANKCKDQATTWGCCLKNVLGDNFVAPPSFPGCAAPKPSPKPSPGQSPQPGTATTTTVGLFVAIIAVLFNLM